MGRGSKRNRNVRSRPGGRGGGTHPGTVLASSISGCDLARALGPGTGSGVPLGRRAFYRFNPTMNRWALVQMSLRDRVRRDRGQERRQWHQQRRRQGGAGGSGQRDSSGGRFVLVNDDRYPRRPFLAASHNRNSLRPPRHPQARSMAPTKGQRPRAPCSGGPGGTFERSPMFQHWVALPLLGLRPGGTVDEDPRGPFSHRGGASA